MASDDFSSRPRQPLILEIRPDVIHIYTKVHNVITRRIPMKGRAHTVTVMGEDFDSVTTPDIGPQPGGLDAGFVLLGGSQIRDDELHSLLTAPFFVMAGNASHVTMYPMLAHPTLTGNAIAIVTKYTTFAHPQITGDSEVTDLEVI